MRQENLLCTVSCDFVRYASSKLNPAFKNITTFCNDKISGVYAQMIEKSYQILAANYVHPQLYVSISTVKQVEVQPFIF